METHIARERDEQRVRAALARSPVVLLTGPRQAGKSTLARAVTRPAPDHLFDLEDPRDLARLDAPTLVLPRLEGTVVIDEAQRLPDLFPVLRVLVDQDDRPGRFLVLGSASPDLLGLASETLAGRVALEELAGFRLADVGSGSVTTLWERGALPRSFLASGSPDSFAWRADYIRTFLERDLANLGVRIPSATMRRFWTMIAHCHGQTWNASEIARSLGVSGPTVDRYLDALTDALVVRQLQPWFANVAKRQVRSPKVYIRDSGLLHGLLGIRTYHELLGHPKVGASWEGFVIEQLLMTGVDEPSFWGTHAGAEIDLLVRVDSKRIGIEIKRTDRPRLTPSIRHALADLALDAVVVAHAGDERFPLDDEVIAVPVEQLLLDGPRALLP